MQVASLAPPELLGYTDLLEKLGSSQLVTETLTQCLSATARPDGISISKSPPLNVVATVHSGDSSGLT